MYQNVVVVTDLSRSCQYEYIVHREKNGVFICKSCIYGSPAFLWHTIILYGGDFKVMKIWTIKESGMYFITLCCEGNEISSLSANNSETDFTSSNFVK